MDISLVVLILLTIISWYFPPLGITFFLFTTVLLSKGFLIVVYLSPSHWHNSIISDLLDEKYIYFTLTKRLNNRRRFYSYLHQWTNIGGTPAPSLHANSFILKFITFNY